MSVKGKHGITATTPQNVLLGAGTYHKGMKIENGKLEPGTIIGATNGGGKISIVGEFYDIPVDGALVKVKGLTVKNGGTCTAEVTFAEVSTDILKMATLFESGESEVDGYSLLQDKAAIAEGDYVEGFGFIGKTANGAKDIIFIMDNALCTSGLELEAKNKEAAVVKLTMEAYADNDGDLDTLPIKILYPDDPVV